MYASSLYIQLEKTEIGEIEKSWSGRNVKISGEITSFSESGGHVFMDVKDSTGEIMVADFDSDFKAEEGEKVNVTGHVAIYKGKLEIIAKEVEKY